MYEDRTQNYDPKIHEEYLIHDTPCHIIYNHVQTSIAIYTTIQTERQQFSAMIANVKYGF